MRFDLQSSFLIYSLLTFIALSSGIYIGRWSSAQVGSIRTACPSVLCSEYGGEDNTNGADIASERRKAQQDIENLQKPLLELQDGINLVSFLHILDSMQSTYFELWVGTWPEAIDWTAAVMGTLVSAALRSLNDVWDASASDLALRQALPLQADDLQDAMNKYFSDSIAFYFGENAFAIRLQAYDDMLWVVLGWLESIRFIDARRRKAAVSADSSGRRSWYGEQFVPVFAHRSRIFYDLARKGYDYDLCDGGMLWNPSLLPYKNAITNELYISASVAMYLYFPGDSNDSPFTNDAQQCATTSHQCCELPSSANPGPYNSEYLANAIEAYKWLKYINMTNEQGLYVDGFHIKNYGVNHTKGTRKCDVRNEMVYTYNQGVILSGLRGLWEGTGNRSYLENGHKLVGNVINATGWDLYANPHLQASKASHAPWRGLGRAGIMEDACDASGTCNQDAQTFKGVFFDRLTSFCEPLPRVPKETGKTFAADTQTAFLHHSSCAEYAKWVIRNAQAALNTRDEQGLFGMWWTRGLLEDDLSGFDDIETWDERIPDGAEDRHQDPSQAESETWRPSSDPNDRHRGRTVETQGGGLAVVRAALEFAMRAG